MKTKKTLSSCLNCKTSNKQCSCFDCSFCCKSHNPKDVTTEKKKSLITDKENAHSGFICRLSMDIKNFSDSEISILYRIISQERHERHRKLAEKAACKLDSSHKNNKNINSGEN